MTIDQSKDEIALYVNSRFIDPHLAVWRMFEYNLQERYPAVMRLDIHEKDKQLIYFHQGQEEEKAKEDKKTKLTAWFEYNREGHKENDSDGKWKEITYMEFPEYYTFNESKKTWKKRDLILKE